MKWFSAMLLMVCVGCADSLVGATCADGFELGVGRCVPVQTDAGADGAILDGSVDGSFGLDGSRFDGSANFGDGGDAGDAIADGAADAASMDGAADGSNLDGSTSDGSTSDGSTSDGSTDGTVGDGSVGDGGTISCDLGELLCGGRCVRPDNDPLHCGGCFMPCGAGEVCVSSVCLSACPPGLLVCGALCVDPLGDDPDNCGACGRACSSGICVGGSCAAATVGHVSVIGHDYTVRRAGMSRIAGNAVFLANGAPVEVLAFDGTAAVPSVAGVNAAIDQVASEQGRSWNRTTIDADNLLVALASADVLVIYPQPGSTDAELRDLGVQWSVGLGTFLRRGGVVALFDTPSGTNAGTWQILDAAGLFSATALTEVTGSALDLVSPSDAVGLGVPLVYLAETRSVWFDTMESVVVVEHADGPVVIHKVFAP